MTEETDKPKLCLAGKILIGGLVVATIGFAGYIIRKDVERLSLTPTKELLIRELTEEPRINSYPGFFEAEGRDKDGDSYKYYIGNEGLESLRLNMKGSTQTTYTRNSRSNLVNSVEIKDSYGGVIELTRDKEGNHYEMWFDKVKHSGLFGYKEGTPTRYKDSEKVRVEPGGSYQTWFFRGASHMDDKREKFKDQIMFEIPELKIE